MSVRLLLLCISILCSYVELFAKCDLFIWERLAVNSWIVLNLILIICCDYHGFILKLLVFNLKKGKKKKSLFERGTLTETTTDIFWARLAEFYTDLLIILNIFICVWKLTPQKTSGFNYWMHDMFLCINLISINSQRTLTLINWKLLILVIFQAGLALGDLKSVKDLYDFKTLFVLFLIGSVIIFPTLLKRKRIYEWKFWWWGLNFMIPSKSFLMQAKGSYIYSNIFLSNLKRVSVCQCRLLDSILY